MVRSGKYTTDQLHDAWLKVKDAENAAAGITPPPAPDFKNLIALGEQYGFTLKEMGKSVQAGNIAGQVDQLIADYKTLAGSGVDSPFAHFESKFQDIFLQAKQFGVEIPEALKPYLQQMVNLGDLVDESGQKVKDLNGVAFKPLAEDTEQLAANQAALAKATVETNVAIGGATDALVGPKGFTNALLEVARVAGELSGVTGGSSLGGPGWIPTMDVPPMRFLAPAMVRVNRGDVLGMWDKMEPGARRSSAAAAVVNLDLRGAYFRTRQDIRDLTADIAEHLPDVLDRKGWR